MPVVRVFVFSSLLSRVWWFKETYEKLRITLNDFDTTNFIVFQGGLDHATYTSTCCEGTAIYVYDNWYLVDHIIRGLL